MAPPLQLRGVLLTRNSGIVAADPSNPGKRSGNWWGWGDENSGLVAIAGRRGFERLTDGAIGGHPCGGETGQRVAQAAGVKLLVLSHLVPADDPAITNQMWIDAAP